MKKFIYIFIMLILYTNLYGEELTNWKITLKNNKEENIKIDLQEENWSTVEFPVDFNQFIHTKSNIVWLRKEITLDKNYQHYILINGINGYIELYFNEQLLKTGPPFPNGSLLVNLPMNFIQEKNVIVMKFYLKSTVANGIYGSVQLLDTSKAIKEYYYNNFKSIANSIFLLGIGFFLISLFFKFSQNIYYFYLSLFYIFAGLSNLLSNQIIIDLIFFPEIFYSISLGLPVFLPIFFIRFFSYYYTGSYRIKMLDILIGVLLFIFIIVTAFFNIYYSKLLNSSWILIFIFVFIYATYLIGLNLYKKFSIRNIITLFFLIYLLMISINSLIDWKYFKGERFLYQSDVTFILLIPAFIILFEIIEIQKNLLKQEGQFQSFDILQTKIFSYILTALKIPIKELIEALNKIPIKEITPNQTRNLIFNIEELEKNLNDILELSRLEALEEPESYIEINLVDFLQAMLGKSSISSTINIDPNLTLETSLELVNSLIIRLIDFPGFGSFQHIDLVVVSDDEYNVYFKFFLYNKNIKVVNRIYSILKEKLPDQEGLWIQWKIIKETIRILGGKLTVKLFSKKFLFIEFMLKTKKEQDHKKTLSLKKYKESIPLVYLYYINDNSKKKTNNVTLEILWHKIKEIFQKKIA